MILLFGFSNKQNIFCYGTYCEPSWILKSLSVLWQTKNIELDHNDALVEPNVEPRACWFNIQTDCAAPALQRRSTSCIRHHIPSSRPRKYQNPRQLIRSRVCVVTKASCGHARWCGLHLIRPWLALAAGRRPHPFQDVFSPIFPRKFLLRISVVGWGFQGHFFISESNKWERLFNYTTIQTYDVEMHSRRNRRNFTTKDKQNPYYDGTDIFLRECICLRHLCKNEIHIRTAFIAGDSNFISDATLSPRNHVRWSCIKTQ